MSKSHRILLVDDEQDILDLLKYNLDKKGYKTQTAINGKEAIEKAKKFKPHLILLDIMMPEMDGIETTEALRKIKGQENVIIALLTALNEDYAEITGFNAGADDFITKPIKPHVLISRIKALLRRNVPGDGFDVEKIITIKNITIDKDKYVVIKDDKEFSLPRKEFELLALLMTKPEKVFTRERIMNEIWGEEVVVGDRTIDVHIRKLREKIGDKLIKTVKGVGYKFMG
jgi:two-component system alkaline phosphatase synthesis response regulator PhoP